MTVDRFRRKQIMTNDSRRFGFTYGYVDAVTAAMQEQWEILYDEISEF